MIINIYVGNNAQVVTLVGLTPLGSTSPVIGADITGTILRNGYSLPNSKMDFYDVVGQAGNYYANLADFDAEVGPAFLSIQGSSQSTGFSFLIPVSLIERAI